MASNDNYGGERYERYNFNASEDDYLVSDILVNLEALIHNSNSTEPQPITWSFKSSDSYEPQHINSYEPTWSVKARNLREPLWHNKRKRSALISPPSPPQNEGNKDQNLKTGEKQECTVYSPSSPLSYEAHYHNNNIQSKHHKSSKRKLKDWEGRIKELEQTKQQLQLSLNNVKRYHQTLLELNTKLRVKRDEVNTGFGLNLKTGHHQFPIFARQQQQQHQHQHQQQQEYTYQQAGGITLHYYPVPFFQANDKILQAAEARHRRKIKINTKKNSNALGIRSSSVS